MFAQSLQGRDGKQLQTSHPRETDGGTLKKEWRHEGSLFISRSLGQEQEDREPQLRGVETGQFNREGRVAERTREAVPFWGDGGARNLGLGELEVSPEMPL